MAPRAMPWGVPAQVASSTGMPGRPKYGFSAASVLPG